MVEVSKESFNDLMGFAHDYYIFNKNNLFFLRTVAAAVVSPQLCPSSSLFVGLLNHSVSFIRVLILFLSG